MYIVDFFKRLFQKNNLGVLAYIVVNVLVGAGLLAAFAYVIVLGMSYGMVEYVEFDWLAAMGTTLIISFVVYLISMLVVLSPLGEAIVRLKYKCKKIERLDQLNHIETQYHEVLEKAKALDPQLDSSVSVYVTESQETTVFALGRKTLAVTSGLFSMPKEKIQALMAREFGHISQKDTDFLLLVTVGNFTVTACIWILRIGLYIALIPIMVLGGLAFFMLKLFGLVFMFAGGGVPGAHFIGKLADILANPLPMIAKKLFQLVGWIGKTLTNLWNKVGAVMVLKTRQGYEYSADEFAFNCGYGETLYDIIKHDNLADQAEGIFKDIVKAYPAADARLAKLQTLGVEYSDY